MKCHGKAKEICQWLDGELEGSERTSFEVHLKGCFVCQKEIKSFQLFQAMLQSTSFLVEPSRYFEANFWKKVYERQEESWLPRLRRNIESLFPIPTFAQAFAIFLIALLIGGTGGAVSAMNTAGLEDLEGARTSINYLSGFSEFKGVPSPSMAGSYLKALEERSQ